MKLTTVPTATGGGRLGHVALTMPSCWPLRCSTVVSIHDRIRIQTGHNASERLRHGTIGARLGLDSLLRRW